MVNKVRAGKSEGLSPDDTTATNVHDLPARALSDPGLVCFALLLLSQRPCRADCNSSPRDWL